MSQNNECLKKIFFFCLKKNLRDKETIYFLVKADWYSSVCILHLFCLSICLLMDSGCSSILALWTMLNMWTWVYKISLWDPVFNSSAYLFRSRTSRAYGNCIFFFFNNYRTSLLTQMVKNLLIMKETHWFRKITWRREWLPTPVFLPGEFHGQRSLASYSP